METASVNVRPPQPSIPKQLRVDSSTPDLVVQRAREYARLFVRYYTQRDGDAMRAAELIRADGKGVPPEALFKAIANEAGCTDVQAEALFSRISQKLHGARIQYSREFASGDYVRSATIAQNAGLPQENIDLSINMAISEAVAAATRAETSIAGVLKLLDLKQMFKIPDLVISGIIERHKLHRPYELLVQQGYPRVSGVGIREASA